MSPAGVSVVTSAATPAVENAPADPEVERWRVYDLSSKGYGLLVDRAAAEIVLLNGLIALRNHETGGWIVGTIVRKLANRVRGEILVGVEVLSYRPVPVDLVGLNAAASTQALYLPGTDPNGKIDSLLLRVGEFRADQAYGIRVHGATYQIKLNRIIRKGADWIKARFEIAAKA